MSSKEFFVPSEDIMAHIVLPTIIFCIGMVVAMLVGINKCKQWELDKVVEMRRTRRVVQRITQRLREKNFKTIEKARSVRKQAARAKKACGKKLGKSEVSPPLYTSQQHDTTETLQKCGTSPPPSYEDALLDEFYFECHPSTSRASYSSPSGSTTNRPRRSSTQSINRRVQQKPRRPSRGPTIPPV